MEINTLLTLLYYDSSRNLRLLDETELKGPRFNGFYKSQFVILDEIKKLKRRRKRTIKTYTLIALAEALDQYRILDSYMRNFYSIDDFIISDFYLPRINTEKYPNFHVLGGGRLTLNKTEIRIEKTNLGIGQYDKTILKQILDNNLKNYFPSIRKELIE